MATNGVRAKGGSEIFLFDTNAFIVFDNTFDPDRWQPVWDHLDQLVTSGILVTIDEVIKELEKKFADRKITTWVTARRSRIKIEKSTDHHEHYAKVVFPACPDLIDPDIVGTLFADPELLTIASKMGLTLVTDECRKKDPKTKPKNLGLPNRCDVLGISCICDRYAITEFLTKSGFRATRGATIYTR